MYKEWEKPFSPFTFTCESNLDPPNDHLIIQDLFDMKCPSWLLQIIFSYLSDRTLDLSFQWKVLPLSLTGGGPQGTVLGCKICFVKFNGAFLIPSIPRPLTSKSISVTYVDDGTTASSINLKESLIKDPFQRSRPLTYHENSELILPVEKNPAQMFFDEANKFAKDNKMIINESKQRLWFSACPKTFNFLLKLYRPTKRNF